MSKVATEVTHFDEAVPCPLYDAAGQPELDSQGHPVAVFVVSQYSTAAKQNAQAQVRALAKLKRQYGGSDNIPLEEFEALDNRAVAACITGWSGFESDGQPFAYTAENAVAVVAGLRAKRPTQLARIEGAIAEHASFFLTRSDN